LTGFPILALALAAGASAAAADAPRAEVEAIVRSYLLDHPEILGEMMRVLREREQARKIAAVRSQLETPYASGWIGARDPDVTIVELFDYGCIHCRNMAPVLEALVREDSKLRVVFRNYPVFGNDSMRAALKSLEAAEVGKFASFHRALLATGPSAEGLAAAAGDIQLGAEAAPTPARTAEIDRNMALAQSLGVTGTPYFIVGNEIHAGEIALADLRAIVARARAAPPPQASVSPK
jgi:protein-disulfide isomerase